MKSLTLVALMSVVFLAGCQATPEKVEPVDEATRARLVELDAYWAEVSRAVNTGDFDAYVATIHPDGVLVSGSKQFSQPLAEALKRWKKEFDATKAGTMTASADFRFAQRYSDATTAHETGILLYRQNDKLAGRTIAEYVHFEALLLKRDGKWQIVMEYQKSKATVKEWEALK